MKAINIFLIIISLILSLGFGYFIFDISFNQLEYVKIYRINPKSVHWNKQSITNFLLQHYLYLSLFIIIFITSVISLKRNTIFLKKVNIFFLFLTIVWFVYNLSMYFMDGFGH